MTEFKIGDVVRLKADGPDRLKLIVRDIEHGFASCVSECQNRRVHAWLTELELVDQPNPHADIKQAIREMLLSDEFMTAFAAAWMNTPIPIARDFDANDGEFIRSIANYPLGGPATEANNDPA